MNLYVEGEVRRVVDVVWATTSRPAKYQVVTQFIETIIEDDLINSDQENVNYLINTGLINVLRQPEIFQTNCVQFWSGATSLRRGRLIRLISR